MAAHHSVWIGPPNRQFCKQRERHSEQADTTHQYKRANRTTNDAGDEREHRERPSQNNRAEALDDVIRTQLSRAPDVTRSCPLADSRVKAIQQPKTHEHSQHQEANCRSDRKQP